MHNTWRKNSKKKCKFFFFILFFFYTNLKILRNFRNFARSHNRETLTFRNSVVELQRWRVCNQQGYPVYFILVSLLPPANIERFSVSHMRDFQWLSPLGQVSLLVAMSVCWMLSPPQLFSPIWSSSCDVRLLSVVCFLSPANAILPLLSEGTWWSSDRFMYFWDPLVLKINCLVIRDWLIALFLNAE